MTIGSRIAQIRKERGLSQEAFGESLGVTRQSISKWEADQSIPDVDKLLAMNKLYGVSVGWILGEENAKETDEGQELTEEQLKMVEKIAEKYISAFSKNMQEQTRENSGKSENTDRKSPKLPMWGSIVIIVVVVGMIAFFSELKNQVSSLQANLSNLQSNVNGQIMGIREQVEELLGEQNSLVVDFGYEVESVDLQNEQITYSAFAVPKTYTEGMLLDFVLETEDNTYQVEGTRDEHNKYSCIIEIPQSDWVTLSIIIKNDGTEQTQQLEDFDGMKYSGKISSCSYSGENFFSNEVLNIKGKDTFLAEIWLPSCEIYTRKESVTVIPEKGKWRIFVDDQVVSEEEVAIKFNSDVSEYEASAKIHLDFIQNVKKGQTVYFVMVVTDNYNRTYPVTIEAYKVDEDGSWINEYPDIELDDEKWIQ